MNGESEADKACRNAGFDDGSATCVAPSCTWDTSTCTNNVNNVNNVNNANNINNFPCDPTVPEPNCDVGEACYYNHDDNTTVCSSPGISSRGEVCFESSACMPYFVCLGGVCTSICDTGEMTCYLELTCNSGFWPEDWGFCPLVDNGCDPFDGNGCPHDGESCYLMRYGGDEIHTACLHTGSGVGTTCLAGAPNECSPGHTCVSSVCVPLCDDGHPCNDGDCVAHFDEVGVCQ